MKIKPYSTKELIREYRVSRKIFSRWLQPHQACIGKREGYFYTAQQVALIIEKIGPPY